MNRRAVLKTAAASLALATSRLTGTVPRSAASPEALIARIPSFPPGKLGDAMLWWHSSHQYEFLDNLETARAVYRRCPELVKATGFDMIPADMIEAFRSEVPDGPSDSCGFGGEELLDPDYQEQLLKEGRDQIAYNAASPKPESKAAPEPPPEPETRESLEKQFEHMEAITQHVAEWRARVEQEIAAFDAV